MRILITGGNGFIGTALAMHFGGKGHLVTSIDKTQPTQNLINVTYKVADLEGAISTDLIDGFDAIIHLAGEPLYGFWSKSKLKRIYNSRVLTTRNIVSSLQSASHKPKVLVSASGMGYYGDAGDTLLTEISPPGKDILAHVCMDWEAAAQAASEQGIRTVQIRTAPVIGKGGIVSMLKFYFKFGLGIWIGEGKNWMPWIDIADLVSIYDIAVHNVALDGPVIGAASSARQKDFMKALGSAMNKNVPFGIPVPLLRLRYGKLALALNASQHAYASEKLKELDFTPAYADLLLSMNRAIKES